MKRMMVASLFLATLCGFSFGVHGAEFPSGNVRLIVPFPAGGATDVIARVVGTALADVWGKPVISENIPGATGTIAAAQVARAEPDGQMLLVGTASVNSVLPSVKKGLAYDTLRDYAPIAMLGTFPNVLVVRKEFPANSVAELTALMKANPGKYTFGSSGYGGSIHLAGELFKLQTGTQMTHVPYKGSAPALADLLGGHVDMIFDNLANVVPHIESGSLKALGVASLTRSNFLPNVPAIAETLPGFEATSWVALLAPVKLSDATASKIADDVTRVLTQPKVLEALRKIGSDPGAMTRDKLRAFLEQDVARWQRVVSEAKLTVE